MSGHSSINVQNHEEVAMLQATGHSTRKAANTAGISRRTGLKGRFCQLGPGTREGGAAIAQVALKGPFTGLPGGNERPLQGRRLPALRCPGPLARSDRIGPSGRKCASTRHVESLLTTTSTQNPKTR
jgi:hypothetical protein